MNKIITIIFSLFILLSCNDDDIDYGQIVDEPYQLEIPSYFPKITFDTDKYPLTKNGVELGKKLFYEGRLSRNNTISCAFCHIQENAFTRSIRNSKCSSYSKFSFSKSIYVGWRYS